MQLLNSFGKKSALLIWSLAMTISIVFLLACSVFLLRVLTFLFYIKHSLFSCFIGLRKPMNPYAWNGLLQLPLSHFWVLVVVYITTLSKVLLLINNRLSWLWSLTFLTLEQSFLSATWSVYRMSDVLLWKATQCTDVFWWHSQSVLFVFQWIASFSYQETKLVFRWCHLFQRCRK